jgi:adenylate cyclase
VRVYRVRVDNTAIRDPSSLSGQPLPLPDKPSIAVLPFTNLSGDPEQEYFVDGTVEEIITALSRLPWLFVIARNSSFAYKGRSVDVKQVGRELGVRYILEGSVRKAGGRVRIAAQLIEAETSAHLWADRFDGSLDDIFELQDLVASSVVGAIEPKLYLSEIKRAIRKPTEILGAYDLYLRAQARFHRWTVKASREAIDLLRQALALDPAYAPAAGLFACCRIFQQANSAISVEEELAEGVRFARRALEAGREDPEALKTGGWGIFVLAGERAAGLRAIERALALNPNSAHAWSICGWAQAFCNRPAPAIEALQEQCD